MMNYHATRRHLVSHRYRSPVVSRGAGIQTGEDWQPGQVIIIISNLAAVYEQGHEERCDI
jgi:hypothetical protein